MEPKDVMSVGEASRYLAMDERMLTLMPTERRIPCLPFDGVWMFSKKSIDKWRSRQARRA